MVSTEHILPQIPDKQCWPHSTLGYKPPAPETIVYQGFKLADVAPPAPTTEVATALT